MVYVVSVSVWVKAGHEEEFRAATVANARGTRREAGNVRFDVAQAVDDPSRFLLYEVYRSPDAFAAHQQTPHYLTWKAAVADWMAQPRQGVKHNSVFFGDGDE
eukprot:m51a1_g14330 hypothetical protein (103) ;mRNA; f:114752-115132